jgi:Holliday junction resolvase RusA-like endonuclease
MELKVITPFRQKIPMKRVEDKFYSINMNQYRNWHPMVENKIKHQFCADLASQLEGVIIEYPVDITYQVFKPSKRKLDKMNVISITSKYLLDAVSFYGCWPDDNDDVVKTEILLPTEIDKDNPRVEVVIKTIR